MQYFSSYSGLPAAAHAAIVVIGNFDGVHRGHKALLQKAKAIAEKDGKKLGVLTFEPHPKRLFRPDEPPGRLTPPDMKAHRLGEEGVDILYSIPFDWEFASRSAGEFVRDVLKNGLNASHIVVGNDFRFGQMRKGEAKDIEAAGIPVMIVGDVVDEGGKVYSSSRIRESLRRGAVGEANAMLGWEWEIWGAVRKGDGRGKGLGYPTANFPLGVVIHPAYGVYAAWVNIEGEQQWRAAAINIGIRPMFEIPEAEVESYILDYSGDLYGKKLRVRPVKFLRSEAKFANIDDLKKQIDDDCAQVRRILSE